MDVRDIISRINYLDNLLKDDTIESVEVANILSMRELNIEKLINEYHRYSICTRKNGLKQTKLPNGKSITAKTLQGLYEKLYQYYLPEIAKPPTIESIFKIWIEDKAIFRSSETISRNKVDWRRFLEGTEIVQKPIEEITSYELLSFYRELVGNEKMTQRCFTNLKSIVNEVYDYAVGNNIVPVNVSKNVSTRYLNFAPPNTHKKDYFSTEERDKLMAHLKTKPKDPYALILIIQFSLGCRIGELKALQWEDINLTKRTIFIHRQMVKRKQRTGGNTQVVLNHTKAKSEQGNRTLPLSDNAMWALERFKELNLNDVFVCVNKRGHALDTNHYNEHIKQYCTEIGIDPHSSHDTRRFVISASLEAGIPDNVVKQNSGHLNLSTTMSYKRDVEFKKYTEEFLKAVQ